MNLMCLKNEMENHVDIFLRMYISDWDSSVYLIHAIAPVSLSK